VAKYLQRSSPKCNGYPENRGLERKGWMPVQAINGRCLKWGYRLPLQSDCHRIIYSLAYIILFSVGLSFATSSLAQSGGQATLILKVTGLRSEKGQIRIAVFNSSEKWLREQPIYWSTINVDSQTVTWRINDVLYGDYGVAVFHDENSNGKVDKNVLGIPLEPYGFSNNVKVTFGPPKWEEAKFTVKGSTAEVLGINAVRVRRRFAVQRLNLTRSCIVWRRIVMKVHNAGRADERAGRYGFLHD
jgi:uncharacterized protein (DUF2141 family)